MRLEVYKKKVMRLGMGMLVAHSEGGVVWPLVEEKENQGFSLLLSVTG